MSDAQNTAGAEPVDPMDTLREVLFGLYYEAGRNVRYVADSGEDRPYWPNRYLQGLKRAVDDGASEVLAYVRRMVMSNEPSRGFGYLEAEGRLDLTVEWIVADSSRPFHHLFDQEMIDAAGARLQQHGFSVGNPPFASVSDRLTTASVIETTDGFAVELTVEISRTGQVVLRAGDGDVTQPADGVLGAVRAFAGLLAQAEAAAEAAGK